MMFVLFTAPVLNARGADQIRTEIRVHRLCLEGTKALVLIFIEYRTIILAYCIYYNGKGGELLSQHGSMFLILCSSFGAHWHSLADFTLYLNKFSWNFGDREKYTLPYYQSHPMDTPAQPACHD